MADDDLVLIRRLLRESLKKGDLLEMFEQNRDRYRVLVHLIQHPLLPVHLSLDILPQLNPYDLVRVIKNTRANPYVRRKAELEFAARYRKLPLGEKVALLKSAPPSLLLQFVEENHPRLLEAILRNPLCTEDLVVRFINRPGERSQFYRTLDATNWHVYAGVAQALVRDVEAPIKMMLKVIPFVGLEELQRLLKDEATHESVRQGIRHYLEQRRKVQ